MYAVDNHEGLRLCTKHMSEQEKGRMTTNSTTNYF
jgi:hypothetical protein